MKLLHITAAALAAAAMLLASCSTKRPAAAGEGGAPATTAAAPAATSAAAAVLTDPGAAAPAARFAAMTAAYGLWQDVQMPVRAILRSPFSISASGRMTLVRDRLIHISVRMLGMEVAVMQVTPDSLFVVDKFHRYLIAEPTERLTARTGLTMADLQSALLGRAFMPGSGPATPSMAEGLTLAAQGDVLAITPAATPAGYSWQMNAATLADGRIALADMTVSVDGHAPARAAFTPADRLTPVGAVAEAVDLTATVAGKKIDARLSYTLDRAAWNTGAAPQLPRLSGYTRVSAAQLLKAGFF